MYKSDQQLNAFNLPFYGEQTIHLRDYWDAYSITQRSALASVISNAMLEYAVENERVM